MVGAPFAAPVVRVEGVAVATWDGVILARQSGVRWACLVGEVRSLPGQVVLGVKKVRFYLFNW